VLATPEQRIAPCAELAIEIEFGGVASLRIPPSTPPDLAAAVVAALSRR
jgi:small basic protein